ncbi:ribosome-recycling factor [Candidatus Phytoplasma pini]|uniref:Ribosome recycling factor n=1 Tax=Candidatus Phytoplasma pini TaxID=267362 RepID=A0A559KK09_9MOLU|nr:ribosome-recycling factor [Candidatus Phytoplasma pini]TVY12428.1 ribosome recycling factor [Candidatus Phytoplasma pini]
MEELAKEILIELEIKMSNSKNIMLSKFINIRTGVANPKLLDKIIVDYYGVGTFLKNMGTINVIEGYQLHIKLFDLSCNDKVVNAIKAHNLGITPQTDGKIIKLIFPQPTEERRKQLIKEIEEISMQTKVVVRNIRRQGNDKIKKMKFNQYLENHFLKLIQDLTDKWIDLIEKETQQKNKELLKI